MLEVLLQDAFILVAVISGLPLLVSSTTGLVLSVFQASTQIQEQSIQFIVKLLSISLAFFVCGEYFYSQLVIYFQESLIELPKLGAM